MLNKKGIKWGENPRTSNVYRDIKHRRYQTGQEIQFCYITAELVAQVYTQIHTTKCILHIYGHTLAKILCKLGQFCLQQYNSNCCGSAAVWFECSDTQEGDGEEAAGLPVPCKRASTGIDLCCITGVFIDPFQFLCRCSFCLLV